MEASAARDRRRCLGGTAAPAARSLIVDDVSRVGGGRGSGGTAAPATRDLIVVASSLRASASRPPLMAAAAFVRSTAASPPLAFLRGVSSTGFSLGVPPGISGLLTPLSLAARGGGSTPRRLEVVRDFYLEPLFSLVFSPLTWPKPPHLRRHCHPCPSEGYEARGNRYGGSWGPFFFYLIWLVSRRLLDEKVRSQGVLFCVFLESRASDTNLKLVG